MHEGLTVSLGDYGWELVKDNDWYEIASDSVEKNSITDAESQLKCLVKAARSTSGYGESAMAFTNELELA
jgi:hypothetical protein